MLPPPRGRKAARLTQPFPGSARVCFGREAGRTEGEEKGAACEAEGGRRAWGRGQEPGEGNRQKLEETQARERGTREPKEQEAEEEPRRGRSLGGAGGGA